MSATTKSRICEGTHCDREIGPRSKGLCKRCQQAKRRHDPTAPECRVTGCHQPGTASHGLCNACNLRLSRHGTTDYLHVRHFCKVGACHKPAVGRDVEDRFVCRHHYDQDRKTNPKTPRCSVPGCTGIVHGNHYCRMHENRWKKHGTTDLVLVDRLAAECVVPGCSLRAEKVGMCNDHYQNNRRYGTPTPPGHIRHYCTEPGCTTRAHGRDALGRYLCHLHYQRAWTAARTGRDAADITPHPHAGRVHVERPCSIEGCSGVHRALGLCHRHYQQERSGGPKHHACHQCGADFIVTGFRLYCSDECLGRAARRTGGCWITPRTRLAIYDRDGWACQICGRPIPRMPTLWIDRATLDHIIPRSKGGTDDPSNLRAAHHGCNSLRSDGRLTDAEVADLDRQRRAEHEARTTCSLVA